MQAIMNYQAGFDRPIVVRSGVGSLDRSFNLPIELSGVTLTINGAACGLRSVGRHKIEFVVPRGLSAASGGTTYPLVLNNNGTELKTTVTLVPARPDIFNVEGLLGPGGRTKLFNVTNRVYTTEPFTVTTVSVRPAGRVATKLRIYLTGADRARINNTSIRIGSFPLLSPPIVSDAVMVAPGVYTIDFTLPYGVNRAGDQAIILTVIVDGVSFSSRLDDTATRFRIL